MEDNKLKDDVSELKTGQELLRYRADQSDELIKGLKNSVDTLQGSFTKMELHSKVVKYLLTFYVIADTLGIKEALKILPKLVGI